MNRRFSIPLGIVLVLIGGLALVATFLPLPGWNLQPWRLWPLAVVAVGLFLVVPPFLAPGRRGLSGLFIPGVPILTTGAILFFASVFDAWGSWAQLWPLEVLALALGFLLAAIFMRVIWLLIPAIIIGGNGLVMLFCALTGWWGTWAVLWTIEPFSVGLALLVVSIRPRSAALFWTGTGLCAFAGFFAAMMAAILSQWGLLGLIGAAVLILAGGLLIARGVLRQAPLSGAVGE